MSLWYWIRCRVSPEGEKLSYLSHGGPVGDARCLHVVILQVGFEAGECCREGSLLYHSDGRDVWKVEII